MGGDASRLLCSKQVKKIMTGEFMTILEDFCAKIICDISGDVIGNHQMAYNCKDILKNSLPLDSASSTEVEVVSQLIVSRGTNMLIRAMESQFTADCQSKKIICGVSVSGSGKTHMAYNAGRNEAYVIICRVGMQGASMGGGPLLSSSWQALVDHLQPFSDRSKDSRCDIADARRAYLFVKLLLFVYVDISVMAAEIFLVNVSDSRVLQEFLLRFHRNGKSESLVKLRFEEKVVELLSDFKHAKERVASYGVAVFESTKTLPLLFNNTRRILICVDEIQALFGLVSSLFFQKQDYHDIVSGVEPKEPERRGLFYAVISCMNEFAADFKWCVYMTGTAFCLQNASVFPADFSAARGAGILIIKPSYLFDVDMMLVTIAHYWHVDPSDLNSEEVVTLLRKFAGRPLLFVDGVFKPLCDWTMSSQRRTDILSKLKLLDILKVGYQSMTQHFQCLIRSYLSGSRRLYRARAHNTQCLVAPLVEHFLFGGKLDWTDIVGEAIASGLLTVDPLIENSVVDEPIVREAIVCELNYLLKKDYNTLFATIASPLGVLGNNSKGALMEEYFAMDLALRTRRAYLLQPNHDFMLNDLFSSFYVNPDDCPSVDYYVSRDIRAVKYNGPVDVSFFRSFLLNSSGALDCSVIYYNIPQRCGCDVAFVACHADETQNRIVGFQMKNSSHSSLVDLTLTLHPANQYLTKSARQTLIAGDNPWVVHNKDSFSHRDCYKDHYELLSQFPNMQKWIRVASTSKAVHTDVYLNCYDSDTDKLLYVLDFNSDKWLTKDIRQSFLTPCDYETLLLGFPSYSTVYSQKSISFSNLPADYLSDLNNCLA